MANQDNKVHYDLVDVHAAPLTFEAGVPSFGVPKALNGSISLDLSAQGNTTKLRADGIVYYQNHSNQGYDGSLNMAMVPDWFRREHLGEILDETAKVQVENAEAAHKPFALLFGFKGDAARRVHVLYNCMAGRPNIKGENKENEKDPDTESLPITAVPLPDGDVKASSTAETANSIIAGWYKSVWQRAAAAED
ncbi:MAG: phage tail protein [Oscillospiraceae bacterium]|nr:phage tail protein [Oscillospiraceae bacterium]